MGAIIGTVAGWERDSRWTPGYRIYTGPAYIKYEVPPEEIPPEERYEYRVRLNITVYLCDSPDLTYPVVIREIKGILMVSIHEEEYLGGLEQWISDVSVREAEELLARSNTEVAGLVPCDKGYDIETYDEEEILPTKKVEKPKPPEIPEVEIPKAPEYIVPKVPKYIIGQIEYLEQRYKEAESVDEKIAIREEIDKIKQRYGL